MSASIMEQAAALLGKGEKIMTAADRQPTNPKRNAIIDNVALDSKTEEVRYKAAAGKHIPWVETLAVTAAKPLADLKSNEDVKREDMFLQQSKELVAEGYRRLRVMRIPGSRPKDFLAEMFKTDDQMYKVRQRIASEQKRIDIVDERRRNQANAKFGKAVGIKRAEVKAANKKQALADIEAWKKGKNGDGKDLEDVIAGVKQQSKGKGKGEKGSSKGSKGSSKKGGGKKSKGKGKGRKVRK